MTSRFGFTGQGAPSEGESKKPPMARRTSALRAPTAVKLDESPGSSPARRRSGARPPSHPLVHAQTEQTLHSLARSPNSARSHKSRSSRRDSISNSGDLVVDLCLLDPVTPHTCKSERELIRTCAEIKLELAEKVDWQLRIKAIQRVAAVTLGHDEALIPVASFVKVIKRELCARLETQLNDLRSGVAREICSLLAVMSFKLKKAFLPLSNFFIPILLKKIAVTVKIIAESAHLCIKAIITHTPLRLSGSLGDILFAATDRKNGEVVRQRCGEYLLQQLEMWASDETSELSEQALAKITSKLLPKLSAMLTDKNGVVRLLARHCYWAFAKLNPTEAEKFLTGTKNFKVVKGIKAEKDQYASEALDRKVQREGAVLKMLGEIESCPYATVITEADAASFLSPTNVGSSLGFKWSGASRASSRAPSVAGSRGGTPAASPRRAPRSPALSSRSTRSDHRLPPSSSVPNLSSPAKTSSVEYSSLEALCSFDRQAVSRLNEHGIETLSDILKFGIKDIREFHLPMCDRSIQRRLCAYIREHTAPHSFSLNLPAESEQEGPGSARSGRSGRSGRSARELRSPGRQSTVSTGTVEDVVFYDMDDGSDKEFKVEQKVEVSTQGRRLKGVVRFFGETEFASGNWVGVELFKHEGRNDGSVKGIRYFTCPQGYGIFSRPANCEPLVEDSVHLQRIKMRQKQRLSGGGSLDQPRSRRASQSGIPPPSPGMEARKRRQSLTKSSSEKALRTGPSNVIIERSPLPGKAKRDAESRPPRAPATGKPDDLSISPRSPDPPRADTLQRSESSAGLDAAAFYQKAILVARARARCKAMLAMRRQRQAQRQALAAVMSEKASLKEHADELSNINEQLQTAADDLEEELRERDKQLASLSHIKDEIKNANVEAAQLYDNIKEEAEHEAQAERARVLAEVAEEKAKRLAEVDAEARTKAAELERSLKADKLKEVAVEIAAHRSERLAQIDADLTEYRDKEKAVVTADLAEERARQTEALQRELTQLRADGEEAAAAQEGERRAAAEKECSALRQQAQEEAVRVQEEARAQALQAAAAEAEAAKAKLEAEVAERRQRMEADVEADVEARRREGLEQLQKELQAKKDRAHAELEATLAQQSADKVEKSLAEARAAFMAEIEADCAKEREERMARVAEECSAARVKLEAEVKAELEREASERRAALATQLQAEEETRRAEGQKALEQELEQARTSQQAEMQADIDKERATSLAALKGEVESERAVMEAQLSDLKDNVSRLQRMEDGLRAKESEANALDESIAEKQSLQTALQAQVAELQSGRDELMAKIAADAEDRRAELAAENEAQLAAYRQELATTEQNHKDTLRDLEAALSLIREQIENENRIAENLKEEQAARRLAAETDVAREVSSERERLMKGVQEEAERRRAELMEEATREADAQRTQVAKEISQTRSEAAAALERDLTAQRERTEEELRQYVTNAKKETDAEVGNMRKVLLEEAEVEAATRRAEVIQDAHTEAETIHQQRLDELKATLADQPAQAPSSDYVEKLLAINNARAAARLAAVNNAHHSEVESLRAQLEHQKTALADLEAEQSTARRTSIEQSVEVERLQKRLREAEDIALQGGEREVQLVSVQKQLNEAQSELAKASAALRREQSSNADLIASLAKAKSDNDYLLISVKQTEQTLLRSLRGSNTRIDDLQTRLQQAESSLARVRSSRNTAPPDAIATKDASTDPVEPAHTNGTEDAPLKVQDPSSAIASEQEKLTELKTMLSRVTERIHVVEAEQQDIITASSGLEKRLSSRKAKSNSKQRSYSGSSVSSYSDSSASVSGSSESDTESDGSMSETSSSSDSPPPPPPKPKRSVAKTKKMKSSTSSRSHSRQSSVSKRPAKLQRSATSTSIRAKPKPKLARTKTSRAPAKTARTTKKKKTKPATKKRRVRRTAKSGELMVSPRKTSLARVCSELMEEVDRMFNGLSVLVGSLNLDSGVSVRTHGSADEEPAKVRFKWPASGRCVYRTTSIHYVLTSSQKDMQTMSGISVFYEYELSWQQMDDGSYEFHRGPGMQVQTTDTENRVPSDPDVDPPLTFLVSAAGEFGGLVMDSKLKSVKKRWIKEAKQEMKERDLSAADLTNVAMTHAAGMIEAVERDIKRLYQAAVEVWISTTRQAKQVTSTGSKRTWGVDIAKNSKRAHKLVQIFDNIQQDRSTCSAELQQLLLANWSDLDVEDPDPAPADPYDNLRYRILKQGAGRSKHEITCVTHSSTLRPILVDIDGMVELSFSVKMPSHVDSYSDVKNDRLSFLLHERHMRLVMFYFKELPPLSNHLDEEEVWLEALKHFGHKYERHAEQHLEHFHHRLKSLQRR